MTLTNSTSTIHPNVLRLRGLQLARRLLPEHLPLRRGLVRRWMQDEHPKLISRSLPGLPDCFRDPLWLPLPILGAQTYHSDVWRLQIPLTYELEIIPRHPKKPLKRLHGTDRAFIAQPGYLGCGRSVCGVRHLTQIGGEGVRRDHIQLSFRHIRRDPDSLAHNLRGNIARAAPTRTELPGQVL